jgi:uncharacterized SAM-binding protein YcdF (DUF218 family)
MPDVSDIARQLLLPPQGLFLMLGFGLIVRRWWPRFGRGLGATAIVLLILLSMPAVARLLAGPLERFAPALAAPYGMGPEAIVVLSAGRLANAPEYRHSDVPDYVALSRLRYAAKLHRETGLPVLVSGGGAPTLEPLAIGMARALENDFNTPVRWIEWHSNNTAENAEFSAKALKQDGVQRIFLVTDAMHMPRSTMAFAKNGLEVVPAPTVFFSAGTLRPLHFVPSAEGLRRSYYALYEWMGLFWYLLQYQGGPGAQRRIDS